MARDATVGFLQLTARYTINYSLFIGAVSVGSSAISFFICLNATSASAVHWKYLFFVHFFKLLKNDRDFYVNLERNLFRLANFPFSKHPSYTFSLSFAICRETPVISAGFQANMSWLHLSKSYNAFHPSSVRVEPIAIVCSGYSRGISTLILSSVAYTTMEVCASDPETNVHSSGTILLLCRMLNEFKVGDSVHESRDSHAFWGSFNMPSFSFKSLHKIFCGFPFSLLDVLSMDSGGRSSNHTLADPVSRSPQCLSFASWISVFSVLLYCLHSRRMVPFFWTGSSGDSDLSYLNIEKTLVRSWLMMSTWMAFGGNTRDLGSFGEETDEITDLHQILEEILLRERGDGATSINRCCRDLFRDENPIHTLRDYSKPSHKGYMNTIELPVGNNVVPLRSDTIRTVKLCNTILMFQQHHGESLSKAWTHIKDLLQKSLIMASTFGSKSKFLMTMSIPSQDKPLTNRPVLDDTPLCDTARSPTAQMNFTTTDYHTKEELRSKGVKSPSKLLSLKYLSQSSIIKQNKNPSSPKCVHFVNLIVILNKENKTEEESSVEPRKTRLEPRRKPLKPKKNCNFIGREKRLKVFVRNFTYECDFMVVEDTTSAIDHYFGSVVFEKPFVEATGLVYNKEVGTVVFERDKEKIMFKMPHKMDMFKHIDFTNISTDRIPPFIIKSDDDNYGSESRPPMLNKENYVPWSSRLLQYAKSRPNRKLIHKSILNGPYVRKMIPEPGDANCEITVTETFHLQTNDELSDKELKQIEADDQAIQTILLGLLEDIYAVVDSCETVQEIWLRVQQMIKDELKAERIAKNQDPLALMANSNNLYAFPAPQQDQSSFNQNYLQQPMPNPEDILNKENCVPWSSRLLRYAKSRPNRKLIHKSILNGPYVRKMVPEPGDANHEITVTETFHLQTDNELSDKELKQIEADDQAIQTILLGLPKDIYAAVDTGQNGNQIRCYNCRGEGHCARNCTVGPRRRDAAYLQTQLLITQKEEAGIQLQ
nr:ribonuclease H-like domain-containing protein [Tanacetum cinerariifolium]